MRKTAIAILSFVLLMGSACTAAGGNEPGITIQPQSVAPGVETTVIPPEAATPSGLVLQSGGLILTILTPGDGETVVATPIQLRLISNVETVLTVNGVTSVLTAGKEYAFPMDLVAGYNSIELVASDYAGNEVEKVLTVIFDSPEE